MTTLIYLISGLLGVAFMMFMRIRSLKQYFKAANQHFKFQKFIEDDIWNLASSVTFVIILIMTIPEIIQYKPDVEKFVRFLFVVSGAIGDWAFALFLSKSKKHIRSVINEKINCQEGNQDSNHNGLGDR